MYVYLLVWFSGTPITNLFTLQIGHKYVERRLLVAEACGGLAPYLPVYNELNSWFIMDCGKQVKTRLLPARLFM